MNFSTSVQLMFALKQPFPILIYICLFCFFTMYAKIKMLLVNIIKQYLTFQSVFCVNICHDSKAKWTLFRV